ncbi:putative transposase for the insertion element IS2606 [Mycobacterium ulcerans str. Harvey]|uniref:Transposase for the insertion element IS2606 n=1 Tax=Mycobacterium ulcerans str. Harvey TaxID=1299332 RepID=A0ABP3AS04_MYCUL|nr:putative transposase for the insertion element IS2606 [Mycobacterium ulcerans str. Harvey]
MRRRRGAIDVPSSRDVDELEVARELVRQAREAGVGLTGLADCSRR